MDTDDVCLVFSLEGSEDDLKQEKMPLVSLISEMDLKTIKWFPLNQEVPRCETC